MTNNRKIELLKEKVKKQIGERQTSGFKLLINYYPDDAKDQVDDIFKIIESELASLKDEGEKHSQAWECPRCHQMHSYLKSTCDCPPKTINSTTYLASRPIEGEKISAEDILLKHTKGSLWNFINDYLTVKGNLKKTFIDAMLEFALSQQDMPNCDNCSKAPYNYQEPAPHQTVIMPSEEMLNEFLQIYLPDDYWKDTRNQITPKLLKYLKSQVKAIDLRDELIKLANYLTSKDFPYATAYGSKNTVFLKRATAWILSLAS